MAIFSPFMQLDSWDKFPVATGDIEFQIISVLFETGMFFVIAGILKLFPGLLRSGFTLPAVLFSNFSRDTAASEPDLLCFAVPLRI
jgi:undecaprenyl pyrophosphate phosphatase UppP